MKPFDTQLEQQKYFEASYKFADDPAVLAKFKPETVKGSQFKQPFVRVLRRIAPAAEKHRMQS